MMRLIWVLIWVGAATIAQAQVILDDDEIAQAISFGPWPMEHEPDPSNRVSGDPKAVALGEALFADPSLSSQGSMSCATCHLENHDFAEPLTRAQGRVLLDRNTQSLRNLGVHRWFGWSGSTDNLWAQSLLPLLNDDEFAQTYEGLHDVMRHHPQRPEFEALFGPMEAQNPEETAVNIAKALAAFQETLTTGQTPFDQFRDALEDEDWEKAALYPQSAQRGLKLFLGVGNCSFCHSGPAFTNGEFHDAGVPYFVENGRVDTGRFGGLQALLSSPFTLAGDYSDDPERTGAWAVETVRPLHSDFGTFRVPGLRNVAKTPPYMHDGSLADLEAVVGHYNTIDLDRMHADGEAILAPMGLTQSQIGDLVAFLESLSDVTE